MPRDPHKRLLFYVVILFLPVAVWIADLKRQTTTEGAFKYLTVSILMVAAVVVWHKTKRR